MTAKAQARKIENRKFGIIIVLETKESRISSYCRKSFSQNVAYFEEELTLFIASLASGLSANWERFVTPVANHFSSRKSEGSYQCESCGKVLFKKAKYFLKILTYERK